MTSPAGPEDPVTPDPHPHRNPRMGPGTTYGLLSGQEAQRFGPLVRPEAYAVRNYRKKNLTPAVRIEGPFEVVTTEGTMRCEDGWLAWDAEGNPYPIAAAVFAATYELAE